MRPTQVTEPAVVKRINRKLAHAGFVRLRKARSDRARQDVGEYYLLDLNRNALIETCVDPQDLARKLGVMADGEEVR